MGNPSKHEKRKRDCSCEDTSKNLRDDLVRVKDLRRVEADILKVQKLKVTELQSEVLKLKEQVDLKQTSIDELSSKLQAEKLQKGEEVKNLKLKLLKAVAQRTLVGSSLDETDITVKELKRKLMDKERDIESKDITIEEKTQLYVDARTLFQEERKERKRLEASGLIPAEEDDSQIEEAVDRLVSDHIVELKVDLIPDLSSLESKVCKLVDNTACRIIQKDSVESSSCNVPSSKMSLQIDLEVRNGRWVMADGGRVLPWELQQADTSQTAIGQNENESSSDSFYGG